MSVGAGIAIVLLAVIACGALFWLQTTARAIFRDEYDEHGRGR